MISQVKHIQKEICFCLHVRNYVVFCCSSNKKWFEMSLCNYRLSEMFCYWIFCCNFFFFLIKMNMSSSLQFRPAFCNVIPSLPKGFLFRSPSRLRGMFSSICISTTFSSIGSCEGGFPLFGWKHWVTTKETGHSGLFLTCCFQTIVAHGKLCFGQHRLDGQMVWSSV